MELQSLIDRLSLQVNSFQEGFEILSKADSLENLAKQFSRIIRGSLLTTEVNIFQKSDDSDWKKIYASNENAADLLSNLDATGSFNLVVSTEESSRVFITLPLVDKSIAGIIIGAKLDKTAYTDFDKVTLQIFAQLFDNAYQAFLLKKKEKELNFSLNYKVLQLNSLIETGIEITKLEQASSLLSLSLERATVLTNASKGHIQVVKDGKEIESIIFPPYITEEDMASVQKTIIQSFEQQGKKYTITLADKESRKGIADFDLNDELLLGAFARQVNTAIENEHLHKEAIEKQNIERDLAVAADIQQRIIPEKLPVIEGYRLAGTNIPSKEVGGDYYDCMPLSDGRFALIMADVSGKGVPASLLVSTLNASLTAYLDVMIPLDQLAKKINTIIYKASTADKFITFMIVVLDPKTGELDIVNAGHNPGFILKNDNTLQKIDAGGVAFGMFDMGLPFEGEKSVIESGERLMLYTDGIPEAMDIDEEEYSDEKMEEFFINNKPEDANLFVDDIVKDVKKYTGDAPQSDDITVMYLIRDN